ncbi:MAG TPA: hypothetical protein VE999_18805, partial [Gemmataceae bacterium]|nr:hypothetical protein [Gemmataceae bacterium]
MPRTCLIFLFVSLLLLAGTVAPAAEDESPPADKEPLLRVDPGGPAAFVTALAFSPDGKSLYAGGWDKVIRVWTQNDKGEFQLSPTAFRVPIGPGLNGAINALALSPDGEWLAAAGNGMARQIAGFGQLGFIVPAFGVRDSRMFRDIGTIYLFNTRDRGVRLLRGHLGHVTALTFGPQRGKAVPPLLSVAVEEKKENPVETQLTTRLWDVDKGESIAVLSGLPSKKLGSRLPGVALWKNDGDAGAMRAALALYDGNLRLWEPGRDPARVQEVEDLRNNLTVAHLGDGRLLTAGYDLTSKQWHLARWSVPAEGQPQQDRWGVLGDGFARALAPLSREGDGAADLAAILVLVPGQKGSPHQYRLRIADLTDEKFRIVRDVLLWRDAVVRQAPVAASLRGKHLAVAGNSDHSIHVYPLGGLLGDKQPAPQILRGDAVLFRHASFIRRGKDLGLLLNRNSRKKRGEEAPQPDRQKGDWVFDFGKRRLTDDLTDWQAARPKAGSWQTKLAGDERTLLVFDGDKKIATIAIPKDEEITDYTLLPPDESIKVPLLAVAAHKDGQPRLALYNAKSGERLRELTGHTERLRSLAFAPDGRLLVSAADDGTVCVWSLTDLATILGKHGRLPGVTVGPADKGAKAVKVLEVESDSPLRDKLKRGDVLVGLMVSKQLRRIDSPRGFYEALYRLRPGTEISLRRGDPDGGDDISFRVGQGIDERKPLFSLYVVGGPNVSDCEWIGWSPVGPYGASSPKAEKYLGWHFNTGDPKAPTRFADAGQYRKYYYRENLLDKLIQRGSLGQVELPRLPAPVIGLWVEDDGRLLPQQGQEARIVRRPRVDLKAAVFERPLSSLSSLTWRLDNGPAAPFDLDQPGEASFRIPITLSRGEHSFVVTARTRDVSMQPTTRTLTLRYQPLPPEVAIKESGRQHLVRQADFTLEADIKPKVDGENIHVTILHRHEEGQEKPYTKTFASRGGDKNAAITIRHRLKLRPGNNEIEVSAVHGGAPAGAVEQETGRKTLSVFYYFKAKPPVIAFRQIVPVTGSEKEEALAVDVSRPMLVRRPVVILIGQIKSEEEPLTEAQWDRGKSTRQIRLDRFEPGKRTEFSFEQRIVLKPGRQNIRLQAQTKNSDKIEHHLTLEYQPPVPVVSSIMAPRDGEVLEGSEDTKSIRVRAEVHLPPDAQPYKAAILINGKQTSQTPVVDEKSGALIGTAVIGPGESRIWVELSNEWGASSSSEVVEVRYVRPPVLTGEPAHEPVPGTSLLNLRVPVLSPSPLERESLHIEVNGKESVPKEIRLEPGEKNRWMVRLLRVPLDAGSREQKIVLHFANTEAACRSPAVFAIRSEAVLPAPEAEFLEPRQDLAVSNPLVTVRFQIRSEGKLETVRLLRDGSPLRSFDAGGARRVGEKYELTATTEVELEPHDNRLSVEAVSISGRLPESPRLVLTYVPPPLRIEIEKLTELSRDGVARMPRRRERGTLVFPEAATGQVWLHGRVLWADKKANRREDYFRLRVFVNGFQQIPVDVVREGDKTETPFRVLLLLNRRTGNRISLVASRQDAGGFTEGSVDCAEPITAQRLHVLALSPYSRPDEVKERLRKAIHKEVNFLRPLTGSHVSPHYLNNQLYEFQQGLLDDRQKAVSGKGTLRNDVLILYYEGGEKIGSEGHFFETYSSSGEKAFGMPCDKLVSYLVNIPGAHVLLLDVDRPALDRQERSRDKIERWKDDYPDAHTHVVVMRCARRGEPG